MAITKISPSVVDFDAGITISTADNLDTLTLTSTDADANAGPYLNLYRNSSSPADSDQAGQITFTGRNDNSQDVDYARIITQIKDASDSSEDGRLAINTMVGGSIYSRMNIVEGETVFNDESIDVDFRVESNGNANMLFVDGGNDRVGIGSAVGTSKLNIYTGNVTGAGVFASSAINLMHTTHTNGMAQIAFGYQPGSLTNAAAYIGYVGVSQAGNGNGDLVFGTRSATTDTQPTERLRITTVGKLVAGATSAINSAHTFTVDQADNISVFNNTETSGNPYGIQVRFSGSGSGVGGNYYSAFTNTTGSLVQKFGVAGDGDVTNAGNSYGAISDERLKENIVDATNKLDEVKQIKIRNFNFIGDDKKQIGVVAQELETIFPALITEKEDIDADGNKLGTTTKEVKYSVLLPIAIKAVQEQQTLIETLEAKVKALEEA